MKLWNESLQRDKAQLEDRLLAMSKMLGKLDQVYQQQATIEVLKLKLKRAVKEKKQLRTNFKSKKQPIQLTKNDKGKIVREYLGPYWSNAQISAILRKSWKAVRNWKQEDFEFALTLRLLSRKSYNHLRKTKCLPLPSLSTLQRYFRDFQITEGLFDSVMAVLKIHAQTLTPKEKIVNLAFDEVHIKSDISWNPTTDQIIGPHSEANTMMLRLMFKKLKIPIWFRFDTALNKEELFKIITKIEEVGYHVKTITCDMGTKNQGLATQLGVFVDTENPENSVTHFENPARPGSKIFWLYDVPHLLKLCRNNLQKYGVRLPDGTKISKEDIDGIKDRIDESTEIPSNSKLRKSEIYNVKDLDKQKVHMFAYFKSIM